jgi:multiple sugar transport system substrate-binding protein
MSVSRREFLRYTALGVGAVTLAACAPKAQPTAAPAAPAQAPKAEAPKVEAPKAAGDKIVLSQWYHEYGEAGCQEAVNRIAKEYSDMQDKVTIEVGWFPGDYVPKVNAALAAGDPPDLFEHHLDMDYVRNDYIVNIDEMVPQEVRDDLIPVALYNCMLKGKMYALPVVVDFQGLYYRKSYCEAAGIDPSPESWTWQKVWEAGEKLTEGRRKGLFLGNAGGDSCMSSYGVPCAGPWRLNPDTLEIDFNVEPTWKTFEAFREYQKKGTLLQGAPMDWWDPSSFNQGRLLADAGHRGRRGRRFYLLRLSAQRAGRRQSALVRGAGWLVHLGDHQDQGPR